MTDKIITATTVFLCLAQTTHADIPTRQAAPVTVVASPLAELPPLTPTDDIGEGTIISSGADDLPDLLRYQLGLPILSTGGAGQPSSLFLRGTESRHTLFLIDGIQVSSATTGLTAIEHLPTALFNQVQVTRGNVSAIHGGSALGGIVSLTTPTGQGKPALSGSLSAGNQGRYRTTLRYGGETGNTKFFIGANTQGTRGQTAMIPGTAGIPNDDDDGYHNQSIVASLSQKLDGGSEIGFHGYRVHTNTRYDNPYASPTDDQLIKSDNSALIAFWKTPFTDSWSSHMALAETVDKAEDYSNGQKTSTFKTTNRQFFWRHQIDLGDSQEVTGGVDWLQQRVSGSVAYDRNKRDVGSVYAGYNARFDKHHLMVNARHDRYSDFGASTTYLAGYGYNLTDRWQITANIGNAFAPPTFNHLFYPSFGNPDLKAEKSNNQEVSLKYDGKTQRFRATVYHTTIRDLIGGYPIRNFAKAEITGLEIDWALKIDPLTINLKATLQDPEDKTTGDTLNRRSRRYGIIRVDYDKAAWRGNIEWVLSGKKIDNGAKVAGYGILNTAVGYRIDGDWQISAFASNIFDRIYSDLDGYLAPRRGLWMQATYQPK